MSGTNFNTDTFRDLTFDLLSGIANDPTKFDEFNNAYMNKIHERTDGDESRKYTKDIYEKILCKKTKNLFKLTFLKELLFSFTNCTIKFRSSIKRFIS